MDHASCRNQAASPKAVHRLEILTSDRPEHDLRVVQQLDAIRALLVAPIEVRS